MRLLPRVTDLLARLVVTLFLTGGVTFLAVPPGQLTSVLTADEAIACIRTRCRCPGGLGQRSRRRRREGQTPLRSEDRGRDGKPP